MIGVIFLTDKEVGLGGRRHNVAKQCEVHRLDSTVGKPIGRAPRIIIAVPLVHLPYIYLCGACLSVNPTFKPVRSIASTRNRWIVDCIRRVAAPFLVTLNTIHIYFVTVLGSDGNCHQTAAYSVA